MENNEVLYRNEFVPTENDVGDYVVHQLQKRSPVSFAGIFIVVVVVCTIWAQLSSRGIIGNSVLHLVAALFLLIAIIATNAVLKHTEFSRLHKKYARQNEEDLKGIKSQFYDDRVESNGKTYNYSEFNKVLYGDSCMFLVTDKLQVLMIKDDPTAFGIEKTDPFWEFLNSKCSITTAENKVSSPLSFRKSV